jgi:endonuclease YncB( thermonuclease family)
MTKTIIRFFDSRARTLQAIAAVLAISSGAYSLLLKPYLFAPSVQVMACRTLLAKDGDSLDCDGVELRLIGDGSPGLSGIDAPEVDHAKCGRETVLGLRALATVAALLPNVKQVEDVGIRDNYLRPLVRLRLKNGDLVEHVLLRNGLAVIWTPAYVPRWCDDIGTRDDKTKVASDE